MRTPAGCAGGATRERYALVRPLGRPRRATVRARGPLIFPSGDNHPGKVGVNALQTHSPGVTALGGDESPGHGSAELGIVAADIERLPLGDVDVTDER